MVHIATPGCRKALNLHGVGSCAVNACWSLEFLQDILIGETLPRFLSLALPITTIDYGHLGLIVWHLFEAQLGKLVKDNFGDIAGNSNTLLVIYARSVAFLHIM